MSRAAAFRRKIRLYQFFQSRGEPSAGKLHAVAGLSGTQEDFTFYFIIIQTTICKLFMNPIDKVGKQEYSFSSRTDRVLKQVKPVRQEVLETVKQLKNSRCFPFGSISAPGF